MGSAQLDIGDYRPASEVDTLDKRFARWVKENPRVFSDLVDIARDLKAAGETRLSAKMIFEVARFRFLVRRKPGEKWALNNSYSSRVARLIEDNYADLRGMFERRALADERAQ